MAAFIIRTLCGMLILAVSSMAFVDVTPIEIGEHPGISGSFSLSSSLKRGNVDRNDYAADANIRYDTNRTDAIWAIGSFDYGSSHGDEIENSSMGHLRWLHRIDVPLYGELFIQAEQDKFKEISNRSLAGGGVRYRFFNTQKHGKGYIGIGLFFEKIRYRDTAIDPNENNIRLNGYLFYTKTFQTNALLNLYAYYQPKADDMQDYLIVSACELSLPIYGSLSLLFSLQGNYDSRPPESGDIKHYDITQKTALKWKF
ncbi:DUF481 domain-containing protein [Hydrogenimonas sp.]